MSEHSIQEKLARLEERTVHISEDVKELSDTFQKYVTHERFRPVEMLVYGVAALIGSGVGGALLTLIFK